MDVMDMRVGKGNTGRETEIRNPQKAFDQGNISSVST